MSSSSGHSRRHSSRSIDAKSQPKWRNTRLAAQPAISVSKVFAQPLQGSPLRSAIDTVALLDDAASIYSESDMPRKRERGSSITSHDADVQDAPNDDADPSKRLKLGSAGSRQEIVEEGVGERIESTQDRKLYVLRRGPNDTNLATSRPTRPFRLGCHRCGRSSARHCSKSSFSS